VEAQKGVGRKLSFYCKEETGSQRRSSSGGRCQAKKSSEWREKKEGKKEDVQKEMGHFVMTSFRGHMNIEAADAADSD